MVATGSVFLSYEYAIPKDTTNGSGDPLLRKKLLTRPRA
jgi:hypothetical protein